MHKDEQKPAPRSLGSDDHTVQFSVPRELLLQLADGDDEKTRVGPLPVALQDELTLLMRPTETAPVAVLPLPALPRAMTPVTISEAELRALLRPQRLARFAGIAMVMMLALLVGVAAVASR
jgi:hypothetical protein